MGMTVIDPGILTTVQDAGRTGCMDSGFSPSGAVDGFSFRLANILLSNPPGLAALEMTLSGASFLFDEKAVAVLTGADMKPLLNGRPVAMNRAFCLEKGDILHTGFALSGVRAYLAVAGGFALKAVLGSCSTNLKARIGGFEGRALKSGDRIPFRPAPVCLQAAAKKNAEKRYPAEMSPFPIRAAYHPHDPLALHVVQGAQASYFSAEGIETFYASVYSVTTDSDRMGVRLEGPQVASKNGTDIVSDGIALGAIQVPGSGKPIVLLHDRQTTGGYAKIGVVITGDVWKLAQAAPGSAVRFVRISAGEAEKRYRETGRMLRLLEKKYGPKR
ncbi:MAG: biotin-dependent carboxyltransferase family protein [Treponema sp.]|jgi:biotin-dependent carboxylase-like uncharacterized protein|nr:biotin-dependent carboxyltransferase family protein [Treponema sp.]